MNAASPLQGTRAVVVDLAVPRARRSTSRSPRRRPWSTWAACAPSAAASRRGAAGDALRDGDVPAAGAVRVVVRVAQKGDGNLVELDAWGDDGEPLARRRAPAPGRGGPGVAARPREVELDAGDRARRAPSLAAAGLLGLGDARAAEHLLEPRAGEPAARTPAADLLYARALDGADDLPDNKIVERQRGAIDRVLAGWPDAVGGEDRPRARARSGAAARARASPRRCASWACSPGDGQGAPPPA